MATPSNFAGHSMLFPYEGHAQHNGYLGTE
jgi:hypothetical protein